MRDQEILLIYIAEVATQPFARLNSVLFDAKHLVDKTIEFVHAFLEKCEAAKEVLRDSTRVDRCHSACALKMTCFYGHPRRHINAHVCSQHSSLYHTGYI